MKDNVIKKITLNNGIEMPLLGLGVAHITDEEICEITVLEALKIGYRFIDTAACYENEKAIGAAIKKSKIDRRELFITTKVWIQDASYEKTKESFKKSLQNLQTDYIDLYLIHMPYGDYHGAWRAMEELYEQGKIRAIGVSNFLEDRLVDLILTNKIVPAVNQIELHPFYQEKPLRKVMEEYKIKTMAFSPLAKGQDKIFTNEILIEIAKKYNKTVAQVVLRFINQSNIITMPKSTKINRLKENFDSQNFKLEKEDMNKIENLDTGKSLILNIGSAAEVYRQHNIKFVQ